MGPPTSFPLKRENNKALKEWGTVVEALSDGIQIILIRRKKPAHNEFFLYPTYRPEQTKRSFQKRFYRIYDKAMASKQGRKVEIRCYAQVKETIEINDVERLRNLSDYYIWTPSHVEDHFKKSKHHKVYVLILRAYQLPKPKIVDIFLGISWVNLHESISTIDCVPILTDEEFNTRALTLKQVIKEQAKCM